MPVQSTRENAEAPIGHPEFERGREEARREIAAKIIETSQVMADGYRRAISLHFNTTEENLTQERCACAASNTAFFILQSLGFSDEERREMLTAFRLAGEASGLVGDRTEASANSAGSLNQISFTNGAKPEPLLTSAQCHCNSPNERKACTEKCVRSWITMGIR